MYRDPNKESIIVPTNLKSKGKSKRSMNKIREIYAIQEKVEEMTNLHTRKRIEKKEWCDAWTCANARGLEVHMKEEQSRKAKGAWTMLKGRD